MACQHRPSASLPSPNLIDGLARPAYVQHSLGLKSEVDAPRNLSAAVAARRNFLYSEVKGICTERARPKILVIGFGCTSEVDSLIDLYDARRIELSFCGDLEQLREDQVSAADFIFSSRVLRGTGGRPAIGINRLVTLMRSGTRLLLASYCEEEEGPCDWLDDRSVFLRSEEALASLMAGAADGCLGHAAWRDACSDATYLEVSR